MNETVMEKKLKDLNSKVNVLESDNEKLLLESYELNKKVEKLEEKLK